MMKMVRAKITCLYKQEHSGWKETKDGQSVQHRGTVELRFGAVYDSKPGTENNSFWTATPNLSLNMYVDNHPAADAIELGKEYYLDFSPVS